MGGFTLIDPDLKDADPKERKGTVLTIDYLKENPKVGMPEITADEIQDWSKGDVLFKLIAMLQTSWFIIQSIARGHQGLALTELELVTLALASLNGVTFAIWWHKPLGLQEPVKVYLKTEAQKVESDTARRVSLILLFVENDPNIFEDDRRFDLSFRDVISKGWEFGETLAAGILYILRNPYAGGPIFTLVRLFVVLPLDLTYIITFPFFVLFPLGIILLLRIIETKPVPQKSSQNRGLLAARIVESLQNFRYRLTSAVTKFVEEGLEGIFRLRGYADLVSFPFGWFVLLPSLFLLLFLFLSFLIQFFALLSLVSFIFTAVFGIVTTSTIHPGAAHVQSFYAPTTKSDRWSRMVIFALFGVIFGGLHCVGWYFKYPTHLEQTLWQATSSAITVIPLIVAPIDFLLATRLHTRDINSCEKFERTALLTLDLIMTILLFIYVPARLSLIAQALALLRNQPPTALVAVDWTQYVPHLFS